MTTVSILIAAILAVPLVLLVAECCAAMLPVRASPTTEGGRRPRVDVLIPAHNEAETLAHTLPPFLGQLEGDDRVWVVADHCDDRTAEVAGALGARVLPRQEEGQRGKGFALAFGVAAMAEEPPEVVIVIDADCTPQGGAIDRLARAVAHHAAPVQGRDQILAPAAASPGDRISHAATVLKNHIRPLGLSRLGLPCLLAGTGMGFPWDILRDARLATGHITEDMLLAVECVIAGKAPRYCPGAVFVSSLPADPHAVRTQRTRWEHGHLQVLFTQVPRVVFAALRNGRPSLLVTACDLAIPPLSLLAIASSAAMAAAVAMGLLGAGWGPATILASAGTLASTAVVAALFRHLPEMSWKWLLAIPRYVIGKLPIYVAFLFRRQRAWVRTARESNRPATTLGTGT